jgi:hypothetical protein
LEDGDLVLGLGEALPLGSTIGVDRVANFARAP